MKWLWRFLIYFVKPVLIWYIGGYFTYQSIRAIASSVASYERSVKKAEIAALRANEDREGDGTNTTKRVRRSARKSKALRAEEENKAL